MPSVTVCSDEPANSSYPSRPFHERPTLSSPVFHAIACLFLVGCSQLSGDWAITSAEFGTGASARSLADLEGTVVVDGESSVMFDLLSGDLDGDYLVINAEGVADETSDDTFVLDLTGFQEVPQNAIFVDLTLDCVTSGEDATCSGLWESVGLDSQDVSFELTSL